VESIAAVLDACILVPAPLCDLLLRAASAGMYRPRWTDDILEELRRTLVNDLGRSDEQARKRIAAMRGAFPEALVTGHNLLTASMTNDPKDRHLLAAAVVSHAPVIVTSNLRDFTHTALAPFFVEAQSPDQFLTAISDGDVALMKLVLTRQANALRNPPKTVADILQALSPHAPAFVTRMKQEFDQ
jgi:predicted nucleic acid-binding protein